MDIMKGIAEILTAPQGAKGWSAIIQANPIRIAMSPDHPGEVIRIDDTKGTREHGHLDADGVFKRTCSGKN